MSEVSSKSPKNDDGVEKRGTDAVEDEGHAISVHADQEEGVRLRVSGHSRRTVHILRAIV